MSCCGNHSHGNNKTKQGSHEGHHYKSHNWIMMLCCVLPIVFVVLIVLMNLYQGKPTNYLLMGILLICPISHMILMPLMNKVKK